MDNPIQFKPYVSIYWEQLQEVERLTKQSFQKDQEELNKNPSALQRTTDLNPTI